MKDINGKRIKLKTVPTTLKLEFGIELEIKSL